jgi:ligand-binding sensor domain-containing protein
MRARAVQLAAAAALLVALVVLAGAAWRERERARHLAIPVLSDPSLPAGPGAALGEAAGCTANEVAQAGARVTALVEDREGALWVGTFDAGLLRGTPPELTEVPGLRGRERFVNALAVHDGLVWAATQGGLLVLDADRRALTLLAGEGVSALARAGAALYAGTARGVFRVSAAAGAEPLDVTGPAGEPLRVTALAATATRLWVGTASGAYALSLASAGGPLLSRTARWHPLVFGDPPAETNVVTALAPLDGGAVAGTDDGGVVRLEDGGAVSALRFDDRRANEVNPGAAAPSGSGALLGTQGGGVLRVTPAGRGLAAARLGAPGRAEVSALHAAGERLLVGAADGAVHEVRCGALAALRAVR